MVIVTKVSQSQILNSNEHHDMFVEANYIQDNPFITLFKTKKEETDAGWLHTYTFKKDKT